MAAIMSGLVSQVAIPAVPAHSAHLQDSLVRQTWPVRLARAQAVLRGCFIDPADRHPRGVLVGRLQAAGYTAGTAEYELVGVRGCAQPGEAGTAWPAASPPTQQQRSRGERSLEGHIPSGAWRWRSQRLGGREPPLSRGHRSDGHRRVRRRRRYRGCIRVLQGQPAQEQRAHQQQHAGNRDAGPVPAVVAAGVPEQPHPDAQVTSG